MLAKPKLSAGKPAKTAKPESWQTNIEIQPQPTTPKRTREQLPPVNAAAEVARQNALEYAERRNRKKRL